MKKLCLFIMLFSSIAFLCKNSRADSYTWKGTVSSVWNVSGNWKDNTTGLSTNYPGFGANDAAIIAKNVTITLGVSLNIASISITADYNPTINVANGVTLAVSSGITINEDGFDQASLTAEAANAAGTGTGVIAVSGTSAIYFDCFLVNEGALQFTSGAIVNFADIYSIIENYSGTLKATSTTFNFSNYVSQINNDYGGTVTATGCTFNITSANYLAYGLPLTGIDNEYGTFNITGSSVVNLSGNATEIYNYSNGGAATVNVTSSTLNLSGTGSELYNYNNNTGANFYITASSTVNLTGSNSEIYNDDNNDATVGGIAGYISKYSVTASTINLGTTVSNGSASSIENNDEGFFYLNAGSVINLIGANTKINNTPYNGGTSYYGVFVCASTSVINPTSSSCTISNTTAAGGATSNPANCFTLLSDASGSATIGTDNGVTGNITGQFNVQRYITGGALNYRNYRLLSCPVNTKSATPASTNYINLAYLSATTTLDYITGSYYGAFVAGPGTSFGGGIHQIINPLIYLYQESIIPGTGYNSSYTSGKNVGVTTYSNGTNPYYLGTISTATGGITSTNVLLPPGNGYLLYYIDNNQRTAVASTQSIPNISTISASGYLNQSNVPLYMWGTAPTTTLTYTTTPAGSVRYPGLTMIGNPYPAILDLYKFYTGNGGVLNGTFYELNDATQQFPAYNAVSNTTSGPTGGSEYVASGQGFYIQLSSSGSVTFKENQKALSTTGPVTISPLLESIQATPPINVIDNIAVQASLKTMDNLAEVNTKPKSGPSVKNASLSAIFYSSDSSYAESSASRVLQLKAFKAKSSSIIINNYPVTPAQPPIVNTQIAPAAAKPVLTGLHLTLVKDSVNYDNCGIYFNNGWSDNFDTNDSKDIDGLSGQVYLSSYSADGVRTGINALGNYTGGKRVKLFAKFSTAGIYQLQMSDISNNFDANNYSVFLLDKMVNDSLDLTLYKSYNFNYAPGTVNDSTRFVLAIEHKPVPYYALLTFAGQKVTQGVQLNWTVKNEFNTTKFVVQKLSANNTYAFLDSLQSDSLSIYDYVDQHPTLGDNTYRLQQTTALGVITYSKPVTIGYNSTAPNGGLYIYPNPAKTQITVTLSTGSTATQVATADIYNTSGTLIEHTAVNSNSFTHDVSSYQLGVYIIELKNSNGLLVGKSKFVKVQ